MAVSSKPARRIDASPQVTRWRAEQARQEGQRSRDRGRTRRYGWPSDREVIIAETLAAARTESAAGHVPDLRAPVPGREGGAQARA